MSGFLTLAEVKGLAQDVAADQSEALQVIGAISSEGDGPYAEVIVVNRDSSAEPSRVTVGVDRGDPIDIMRDRFARKIRDFLSDGSEP